MPRWMHILWLVFVISLVGAAIVAAIRLDCGFATRLGFLVISSALIFIFAPCIWGVLYAVSILLEGRDHRYCRDDQYDDPRDMANFVP